MRVRYGRRLRVLDTLDEIELYVFSSGVLVSVAIMEILVTMILLDLGAFAKVVISVCSIVLSR